MKKKISVEYAIKIGKRRVVFPFYFILLSGFSTIIILISIYKSISFLLFSLIFLLLSSILISNKLMSKWKIWAFSHVRNVHELKRRALEERLLYGNSPFLEKLEFKSNEEENL